MNLLSRCLVLSDPDWAEWEGVERGSVRLPGKSLSLTQFPWLQRTSLSLPVGGQRLCEAMFGRCSTGNHEYYCWLEPLATEDKWGKEGKNKTKQKPGAPPPPTSLWGCPQYKWDILNQCGHWGQTLPLEFPVTTSPKHSQGTEEGKKHQQPKYNKHIAPILEQENNQSERSLLSHVKACGLVVPHVCAYMYKYSTCRACGLQATPLLSWQFWFENKYHSWVKEVELVSLPSPREFLVLIQLLFSVSTGFQEWPEQLRIHSVWTDQWGRHRGWG